MKDEQIRALVALIQAGDEAAGEKLLERLSPLVMAFASRMCNSAAEREDLYQVGTLGLFKAASRFNIDSPNRFTTYAVPWIRGEMKQYRRSHLGVIKISRSLREQWLQVEKHRSNLYNLLGRSPTMSELAREAGVSPEELALILEAAQPVVPLSEDTLPLLPGLTEEAELVDRIALGEGISRLAPLERELIKLRYFQERTQKDTARYLSLTQRQVSRLEKRILEQLKQYLEI